MAQRKPQRQKPMAPSRAKAAMGVVSRAGPAADGEDWREECERLRNELQVARQEIAELRAREEQVLNRIDWVLDSLDTLARSE